MPDLEDPLNKWEIEKVLDKCWIKSEIHYLVKWANWPSEYNFYEPAAHLVKALKAIAAYEKKVSRKRKCKANVNED